MLTTEEFRSWSQRLQLSKSCVGERALRRDPVGNGRPEDDVLTCSFSGVNLITPARLAETGGRSVGCPECGAMRTLQPYTKTVTFPSHQRRLTPPS